MPLDGTSQAELYRIVAAVESQSSHPLARALLEHTRNGDDLVGAATYETVEGEGVVATVGGRTVHIGNHRRAERLGLHDGEEHGRLEAWMAVGRTVVYVEIDGRLVGHLSLADVPRPEAKAAVAELGGSGVKIVILTGDNAGTAKAVGRAVGVDQVLADLLPAGKVDAIRDLRAASGPPTGRSARSGTASTMGLHWLRRTSASQWGRAELRSPWRRPTSRSWATTFGGWPGPSGSGEQRCRG